MFLNDATNNFTIFEDLMDAVLLTAIVRFTVNILTMGNKTAKLGFKLDKPPLSGYTCS